jgi:hypothetical protein
MISKEMFSGKYSPKQIVQKHFSKNIIANLAELATRNIKRTVSYYDSSSKTINKQIHTFVEHSKHMIKQNKTLENGITYYYHQNLICKAFLKLENKKLYPNYMYKIVAMYNKEFELEDEASEEIFKVSHKTNCGSFSLPYCNSVHSSQGDSIAQHFAIADWKSPLIDMKWLYTSITRATDLDTIYFLDGNLTNINIDTVCDDMVARYKYQDIRANRMLSVQSYVTSSWIKEQYIECGGKCKTCNNHMTFEKSSQHKVTVDRENNNLCHTKSNCYLMCKNCNASKSNK